MKEFKPKEFVTKSTYKRKSIVCVCGKELNVDYDDGKLVDHTWCVDCHRYYEKKGRIYVITSYKCFECQTKHKELFSGFNRYGEPTKICKSCLDEQIKDNEKTKEAVLKRLKVLHNSKVYNPDKVI